MEVKMTSPKVDTRPEQPYIGIRTQVPTSEFPNIIPQFLGEVFGWLTQKGIEPAGDAFMRYHVINMPGLMDVTVGVPVSAGVAGEGRIQPGTIPAGRYASLIYTGVQNGIPGNAALIEWAHSQNLRWDRWDDPAGDAFASRYEIFLDGPDTKPDPADWDTEVAIKLAD